MDVKWLEDFVALARTRSFSVAAGERHVTQPAFSRRIQALEFWTGVALVDRSSYPVSLTDAGRRFRETAEETLRMLASARDELRAGTDGQRPTIAVAALHSLATAFFPRWLRELQHDAGPLNSRLLATDYQSCVAALADGACDFMLTFWHADVPPPLDPLHYPHLTVGIDAMVEVHAADRAANDGAILRYSRDSFLGRLTSVLQPVDDGGSEETHVSENAMAEGLKSMILAGHGTGWVPSSLVEPEIADGRLVATGRRIPLEIRLHRTVDRKRSVVEAAWGASRRLMPVLHKAGEDGIGPAA